MAATGKIMVVAGIIFMILAIGGWTAYSLGTYEVHRDTLSWVHQASQAPTAIQKAEFLKEAKAGLEKHGLTSGYNTWWYPTPSNDMAVKTKQIDDTITYAQEVEKVDKNSFNAYSSAFGILETKVNTLDSTLDPVGAYTVKNGMWTWPYLIIFGFFVSILLMGFGAFLWND